jgi:acyl-CoA synthetase (AMP-forming)/AMP-acid ligase II
LESHLQRLGACGVTHISGTPSHWRRVLWSPMAHSMSPRYVRLSGEIADQTVLDNLHTIYPQAAIGHAYASTEAGVGFAVDDMREGFPASLVRDQGSVAMRIVDDTLRIRSSGISTRYLGDERAMPIDDQGFIDTGDLVELRGDRYYFVGRHGGVINVGGMKVYPEEVEILINQHPDVRASHVRPKKNPILGNIVVADIVLREDIEMVDARKAQIKREVMDMCRRKLAEYKVPTSVNIVAELNLASSGKLARSNA